MSKNINIFETNYRDLIKEIMIHGYYDFNRTESKTKSIFNISFEHDMSEGFPIVTGKKIFFDKAQVEYKWFVKGERTTDSLEVGGVTWWEPYKIKGNDLGPVYGWTMRNFNGSVDQLEYAIQEIKSGSRRAVISLWNPIDIYSKSVKLPNCYTQIIFNKQTNILA